MTSGQALERWNMLAEESDFLAVFRHWMQPPTRERHLALTRQARVDILHVIIGIDSLQERLDLGSLRIAQ